MEVWGILILELENIRRNGKVIEKDKLEKRKEREFFRKREKSIMLNVGDSLM